MQINFNKSDGLVPVIIQEYKTQQVLMLGYMNQEALEKTIKEKIVTFYSRTKSRLWTKGETSGNLLKLLKVYSDCDNDALLMEVEAIGPTCHSGEISCFKSETNDKFLYILEHIIESRLSENNKESYTRNLYKQGINKVAQKVGEEAVELIIEAKDDDENLFLNEAADLMYHFLLLLKTKKLSINSVDKVLKERHNGKAK